MYIIGTLESSGARTIPAHQAVFFWYLFAGAISDFGESVYRTFVRNEVGLFPWEVKEGMSYSCLETHLLCDLPILAYGRTRALYRKFKGD
ncbi:MAG: hypothetical protein HY367_03460 [Candidatus Aenigmarchaeota archaeon]|nr:hypothetical protein [Candidatus Aenigmarchaeota archaeon]